MAKPKKERKNWYRQSMIEGLMKKIFLKSPMYYLTKEAAKVTYTAQKKDGSDSKAHRVKYRCATCQELFDDKKVIVPDLNEKGIQKKKRDGTLKFKKIVLIQIDHVDPVINPRTGRTNMIDFIERQFVGISYWDHKKNSVDELKGKLQLLCHTCHNKKSAFENAIRRESK